MLMIIVVTELSSSPSCGLSGAGRYHVRACCSRLDDSALDNRLHTAAELPRD